MSEINNTSEQKGDKGFNALKKNDSKCSNIELLYSKSLYMNWRGGLRDYLQAVKKPSNTHKNEMLKQSVIPGKKTTAPEVFLYTSAAVKNDNHDKRTSLILGVNEDIQEYTSAPKRAWICLGKVATNVTKEQIM
ncbi:hypothetical protein HHI36_004176 [Cryptolaemus montrouzieri]|uniref:Uncharacterized protein n=1 Tax=Cryptolaemus montrouzieri TaxID=559131 RepID=A0ABD2NQM6_9CUCU